MNGMSFMQHELPYATTAPHNYYDVKEVYDPTATSFLLLPSPASTTTYPFQPAPVPYQQDPYHNPLPIQSPVFYYTSTAGPSAQNPPNPPCAPVEQHVIPSPEDHWKPLDSPETADTGSPRRRGAVGSKRGRPTKNPVWTFFRRIDDKSVQCNMCARLVKSACATNMSKHIERHHQDIGNNLDESSDASKYSNYANHWQNGNLQNLKLSTSFDGYNNQQMQFDPALPWNPDRRGSRRNRRTKHPVWELFRRTADGQAQCQLCNVLVRSPCSSNFMGHLNRHHIEHYQDVYNRWLEGRVESTAAPETASEEKDFA